MKWVIVVAVSVLLLGPLRRRVAYPIVKAWMTLLPFSVGWVLGHVLIERFIPGAPDWMRIVGPLFVAVVLVEPARQLIEALWRGEGRSDG